MLIDGSEYIWNERCVKSIHISAEGVLWAEEAIGVYRLEGAGAIRIYEDNGRNNLIYRGTLPYEPDFPIFCDGIYLESDEELDLYVVAQKGLHKLNLSRYMNTCENMEYVSNGYNDDGTYSINGLDGFMFNGINVKNLFISSNLWIGFGVQSEQLQILRRDGCSTAIYRQSGMTESGIAFLKIRFEGYTVFSDRTEQNRLIYELFLLSNNDMFLNVIQIPTSGNIGFSALNSGGESYGLSLTVGHYCFFHQDENGKLWRISNGLYEVAMDQEELFLVETEGEIHTIENGMDKVLPDRKLSAALFVKYGTKEIPASEVLVKMRNPKVYMWTPNEQSRTVKADVRADPYPQILTATADMRHSSIQGIRLLTAEYAGDVRVAYSVDMGVSYSAEEVVGDWLNTDVEWLWERLKQTRQLILRFVLYGNSSLLRFKITYIN